jgi:hypothetical protein
MIDKNRTYKTRDGREVRIYATDGDNGLLVHGAVCTDGRWGMTGWNQNGHWLSKEESEYDLIEVRPRHKRTVWLNVYDDGWIASFSSKQTNVKNMVGNERLIACIKVELDFEEGEGL